MPNKLGLSGRIAHYFIDSKLTPLIILASIVLGLFAVAALPREEEPQIKVPMVDVFVQMPGASPKEIEERVTNPMEKLLWEIPGVEYIYTTTSPGMAMAVVRFYVGEDMEDSLVKLYNKMMSNFDKIPPGASQPLIKPRSIDDVPIIALTFWGKNYDGFTLRQIATRVEDELKDIDDVSETMIIGGQRRQMSVTLDPAKLSGYGLTPGSVAQVISSANFRLQSGSFSLENKEYNVETGDFLRSEDDLGSVVVGVHNGRPVFLSQIADIEDGAAEPSEYVLFGLGKAAMEGLSEAKHCHCYPAVTISVAKRQGKNAIVIARKVEAKIENLKGRIIPKDLQVTVTRNYGETALEKSNELLKHMLIAIVSVSLLVAFALGKREAGVVAIAVPVTLALTLVIFKLYGYTLNRITLFALIFSIGILVDDAIVVVENIVRHFRMKENAHRALSEVASEAVDEVGNPTILATFTVIAAILPMAFVGGLMGPYMRPIPVGASAAMLFSLLIAFIISPWASLRLLCKEVHESESHPKESEGWTTRLYRKVMTPLVEDAWKRTKFFALVAFLLISAISLLFFKIVTVKMLPFDNKSEFQVIIDMPEGSTLEYTAAAAQSIGTYIAEIPEVSNYQIYVGTASPYNFNGLVRHYFLRRGPNVADIQVNLVPKHHRKRQSHDVVKSIREKLHEIGALYGANVKAAEVPPGPPVLQTLVAEVYGPDYQRQIEVARQIKNIFESTEGVTDVDWYVEDDQPKYEFIVDTEKAAINGISTEYISRTIALAINGYSPGLAHIEKEKEDVPIMLKLSRAERSGIDELMQLGVQGQTGKIIPLGELVKVKKTIENKSIYHKNLMPVVYVTGDVTGRQESPVYSILKMNKAISKLEIPEGYQIKRYTTHQPTTTEKLAMKWDGEWHITYEVFRDMGIAFAAVLILIYILVVAWFQDFKTPLAIMAPIPLTLVGILPAHALMGAFFTATSMIGFIAGAGIIVRNSIILVDFVELRRKQGMPLAEAVVDAGAVRFRPMLLTAAAVIVGASVILFDPIFQGLAISLMAGEIASTLLSRMAVPLFYYLLEKK